MAITPELQTNVFSYIRRHNLIGPGQKVLVAVSGGADSVCLLHVLYALRTELQISLHAAHLNHGLRGAEADADAEYVARLAQQLAVPLTAEKRDVAGYKREHRLTLEEAARVVRYAFLADAAKNAAADVAAVGHTCDDQVETILLHIIRGTGTRGLRGLAPVHKLGNLKVVRPLLETSRRSTLEYCAENGLEPQQDSSNRSLGPMRNRVRLELLPLLKKYNPAVEDSLLRTAQLAASEAEFLQAELRKALPGMTFRKGDNLIFDRQRFATSPAALQREMLRLAFEELLGTLKDIESRHIELIMNAVGKPPGRVVALPGGLTFAVDYDRYVLGFKIAELVPFPEISASYALKVPGLTKIPGWRIEASVKTAEPPAQENEALNAWGNDGFTGYFDFGVTGDDITLRAWRRGDVFHPLGLGDTKKVGRFMIDAHVPRDWRGRIPLLANPRQIIWLAGWRIDERAKVTPETREVLCLKLERLSK